MDVVHIITALKSVMEAKRRWRRPDEALTSRRYHRVGVAAQIGEISP